MNVFWMQQLEVLLYLFVQAKDAASKGETYTIVKLSAIQFSMDSPLLASQPFKSFEIAPCL